MVRLLVVSRYLSVRMGLRAMLEGQDLAVPVSISAGLPDLETEPFEADVALLDWDDELSPPLLAWAGGRELGVVVLGASNEIAADLKELEIPGWALLPREAAPSEMIAGALAAKSGLYVFSILDNAISNLSGDSTIIDSDGTLTVREREIIQLLGKGLSNKQIAYRLEISAHTVKFHVAAILAKLGVASRAEAVAEGIRRGLIHF